MTAVKEIDLYKPVKEYFINKGYDVKSEVLDCDVIAIKGNKVVVIEMKLRLNLELILQGIDRQKLSEDVYVAVPKNYRTLKTKKWKRTINLLKRLDIGLILVSFKNKTCYVEELITPQNNSGIRVRSRNIAKLKKEFECRSGDNNVGGSNHSKIVTAYREQALHIAYILEKKGPLSIKALKELGTDYKKTGSILQKNYYNWFDKVDRGVYSINERGLKELKSYENVIKALDVKI
ncbi:hypothetical protein EDC18_10861 [Natranaerovirga pectinivora]|uniref:Uncharacterized protein n=1 Tax=Natranaerovirga pectinivora TaxID=682400 RepID=A0A4R3MJG4_9FIRM|nr:DUF2161 family putative PD-(D/E)XK-type phosphodiesterase [Natranaerovirga pectinivora]TCT13825.1 hypothetical protein EDC18_10861 [Natranaerovirga pectinivora]